MTNAISFLFQSWIIVNCNSCASLEIINQMFTCQKALSISIHAGSVTEVTSRSATHCAVQCIYDKLCQRASYDEKTNVCRMSHDISTNDCDVEKEATDTSVFCWKPQGKYQILQILNLVRTALFRITIIRYVLNSKIGQANNQKLSKQSNQMY